MSKLQRYAVAVVLTGLALGLALLGEDAWGAAVLYSFFLGAVMLSSWAGGLGPGLLATALGTAAADLFTIAPLHTPTFDLSRAVQLTVFIGISVLISSLNDSRRAALAAVGQERAQLEARVVERTADLSRINDELRTAQTQQQQTLHALAERVKELTLLNFVGRRLNEPGTPENVLRQIVAAIPPAWQYPDIAEARILFGAIDARTDWFEPTPWMQRAEFQVPGYERGVIEVAYRQARPDAGEGPFLHEERTLLDLLARMLRAYFDRVHAEACAEAGRRQAHEANAAKDQFLATVSHELRSPLNVMLGWTQMLRGNQLSPDAAARGFDVLERSIRLQARLIEDLLDVSRIVTGQPAIDRRPIDLVGVAGAAVDAARPAARAKQIALTVSMPTALWLDADPHRLQQVISNLITNALKFTPAHGAVEVRVERTGRQALVIVRDTGIGIAPDVLPRIFDRFEQGDQAGPRGQGGLGLGLAIAKHFVEQHGGQLAAASAGPGCGSTFTIALPVTGSGAPAMAVVPG